MTFQEYSAKSKETILQNIKRKLSEVNSSDEVLLFKNMSLLENLEAFATKGKFVRGTLFLMTAEMFSLEITDQLIDIASAIELVHSGLLIHDDIIDNDLTRRGDKTIYATYIERGDKESAKDTHHYGVSMGLVVGDISFFTAMSFLSSAGSELPSLLKLLSDEIRMVCLAEAADSELGQTPREANKEEIHAVYKHKTARYTFTLPFVMAGIIAKADSQSLRSIEQLGELAGIIFQIKDDEIGLFGDEEKIGKPIGSDIREDKKTLIRAMLLERASEEDKEFLKTAFGNQNITNEEIGRVIEIGRRNEIPRVLHEEITEIMKKVWELFDSLQVREEYKNLLKELLEFNVNRSY